MNNSKFIYIVQTEKLNLYYSLSRLLEEVDTLPDNANILVVEPNDSISVKELKKLKEQGEKNKVKWEDFDNE